MLHHRQSLVLLDGIAGRGTARARPTGEALVLGVALLVDGLVGVARLGGDAVLGSVFVDPGVPTPVACAGSAAVNDVLY